MKGRIPRTGTTCLPYTLHICPWLPWVARPARARRPSVSARRSSWGGLPGREGGQQLVADMRRGDAGDLGVVVGGRGLHDVGADEVEPGEGAQRGEQFPAG